LPVISEIVSDDMVAVPVGVEVMVIMVPPLWWLLTVRGI
jgi:hypothetical protein